MGKKNNKKFKRSQRKPYERNKSPTIKYKNRIRENDFPKEQVFTVKNSLKEDEAGMTEYINKGEGFKGILKSRFSDFHVNEIDLSGDILQLTDLNIPEGNKDEMTVEDAEKEREKLKSVISEDLWKQIDELVKAKYDHSKDPKDSAIFLDVTGLDKEQRTLIHKVIKRLYKNKLVSSTIENRATDDPDKKKLVRVMRYKGGGDRKEWPFPNKFVHFLVHKENMDTIEVASAMANKMNLKASQVDFCGTKDKRAKTTQKFSIKNRTPRQIVGSVKYLNGVTIGNFNFKSSGLGLGDLHGNRFRIAIRNLSGDKQHMENLLNNVKEKGFINYFGLQRFGNCSSIPTYEIGIALLKADYKLACELILKPRDNDLPFLKRIREMWWEKRDSKLAAAQFRNERFIEKKLLDGLATHGEKNYEAALCKLPRNMLLLYPHAFQSLIFNQVASRRIKEFGLSLLPGDIVFKSRNEPDENTEANQSTEKEENTCIEEEGNPSENNNEELGNTNDTINKEAEDEFESNKNEVSDTAENEEVNCRFKKNVRHLTEEDIASGEYTIYDTVLTLPGNYIAYPENVVGTWYKELLAKYGISFENLKKKMFSMKGAYRRLVVKPKDMSWKFTSYSTPEESLILSDLEILQGKKIEDFKKVGAEPKYEALLLDFCLPSASYATMMLRELLKFDTSSSAQSKLQKTAIEEHSATNEINIDMKSIKDEESLENRQTNNSVDDEEEIKPAKVLKLGTSETC